jgi:hypothetical protein
VYCFILISPLVIIIIIIICNMCPSYGTTRHLFQKTGIITAASVLACSLYQHHHHTHIQKHNKNDPKKRIQMHFILLYDQSSSTQYVVNTRHIQHSIINNQSISIFIKTCPVPITCPRTPLNDSSVQQWFASMAEISD